MAWVRSPEPMDTTLRLGTRGSELALAQSRQVAGALEAAWPGLEVELVIVRTQGDRQADRALASFGGKGIFTRELEEGLLEGSLDFAVHSLKDLPGQLPGGLVLAPAPPREDPRDALISRVPLAALPEGARLATGSPRRRAQLLALRPDLVCLEMRGNLPTRARKWREGQCEATVLALAGLNRLGLAQTGLASEEVHALDPSDCLPAPGQGLLGLEHRGDDARTAALLEALRCPASEAAAQAERAFLAELQGGCQAPAAAYARIEGGRLVLEAFLGRIDGSGSVRARREGRVEEAAELGRGAARELLDRGGRELLAAPASGG